MNLDSNSITSFINSVKNNSKIIDKVHNFYNYPARFSPTFARAAIELFTDPNDIVFDPFMGGGTTLVEARLLGRVSVGVDINELAYFISKVKTTIYNNTELTQILEWSNNINETIVRNFKLKNINSIEIDNHYTKNMNSKELWRIKKVIALLIFEIDKIEKPSINNFIRCALLKTGQWALDCKTRIPSMKSFLNKFIFNIENMVFDGRLFASNARKVNSIYNNNYKFKTLCINRSIIGIENDKRLSKFNPPKLILTSPPYPGVHVVYNRWQINGRKETPVPYWISNTLDGKGESYYSLGTRHQKNLGDYFNNLFNAFNSIASIMSHDTIVVQLVAFSEPSWQLPKYLQVMRDVGLTEYKISDFSNIKTQRLWRSVPNRKWYTSVNENINSDKEVVLIHKLDSNNLHL